MHRPGHVQGGQEAKRGYLLLGVYHRRIPGFTLLHCKKGVSDFPFPSRDVPSGGVWYVTSRLGTEKSLTFFLQCRLLKIHANAASREYLPSGAAKADSLHLSK
jgi:hypothetical protein